MKICYYQLESVDSTNAWVKRQIASRALDVEKDTLVVVSTQKQTAGRGRWARAWISPPGKNGCLTLVLRSEAAAFCLSQLTTLVLQKLLSRFGIDAHIKWPNDLHVAGKKISGILLERIEHYTLIGIGLNINMNEEELQQVDQAATSIAVETKQPQDVLKIIQWLVTDFSAAFEEACQNNFELVAKSWHEKVQWMLSGPVSVQTKQGRIQGRLQALRSDGSLSIQMASGSFFEVQSADTIEFN